MSIAKVKERGIVKDEEICGGSARIEGTRIRVVDIIAHYQAGRSPEEIAYIFRESIDLGDVHRAISYYYKHKDEFVTEEEETRKLVRQVLKEHPSKVKQ